MRIYPFILTSMVAVCSASVAFAADKVDWSPCQTEITKWCQGVKEKSGEEALYQCLLKRDADLSKKCDNDAHSRYEQVTGKTR